MNCAPERMDMHDLTHAFVGANNHERVTENCDEYLQAQLISKPTFKPGTSKIKASKINTYVAFVWNIFRFNKPYKKTESYGVVAIIVLLSTSLEQNPS